MATVNDDAVLDKLSTLKIAVLQSEAMDGPTRMMIGRWVALDHGDQERTARWMSRQAKIGSLRECRKLVRTAMEIQ